MADYIVSFPNIEPALHFHDIFLLVMVYYSFQHVAGHDLLIFSSQCFSSMSLGVIGLYVTCLVMSLSGFSIRVISSS